MSGKSYITTGALPRLTSNNAYRFTIKDPGCQMVSGSFDPINVGDWSGQAYGQVQSGGLVANIARTLQRFILGAWSYL